METFMKKGEVIVPPCENAIFLTKCSLR